MDQYQDKINNYVKQCIVEIYNHGVEYHNNDDIDDNDKTDKSKKIYINGLESTLKKLLNNVESVTSQLKFELINNSSISNKKTALDTDGVLDMINYMESDYESNDDDDDDDDSNTLLDEDEGEFNGTDSVKASRYIGGGDEEDGNIFYDNTIEEEESGLEGCWVRQKRTERKKADDDTPEEYFKDDEGYIYGQHCGREVFNDNLCEGHFLKREEKGKVELVTEYPTKYESTIGKNLADDTDTASEQSLTRSKVQDMKTITHKNKKYLVDDSNGHLFDIKTNRFLGKRTKNGKKYDYKFNQ